MFPNRLVCIFIVLVFLWQGVGVCTTEKNALRPALVCGIVDESVDFQDEEAGLLIRDEAEKIKRGLVRHDLGNIFGAIHSNFVCIRDILEDSDVETLPELCERIRDEWRDFHETLDISILERLIRTTKDFFTEVETCLKENKVKVVRDRKDIEEAIENIDFSIQGFLVLHAKLSTLAKFKDIDKLIDYYKDNFKHPAFSSELCYEGLKFEKENKDEPIIIVAIISNLIETADRIANEKRIPANIKIKTAKENDDEWIRIEVSDTGQGFPEEVLRRVFKEKVTTREIDRGGRGFKLMGDYILWKGYKIDRGGKGLKLTGDYILWKGAKIQIDTKNILGDVYRLVLDGRLKKRIFFTETQITDGLERKEIGTTVTMWLLAKKTFWYRIKKKLKAVVCSI